MLFERPRHLPFAVLLVLASLFYSCTGTETGSPIVGTDTGNPTVLTGVIQDSAGSPVAACSVWVRRLPVAALAKTIRIADTSLSEHVLRTDADGSYEFVGLPAGSYALVAIARDKKLGIKLHVQLAAGDTVRASDGLVLSALERLLLEFDESWLGDTAVIAELGLRIPVTSQIIALDDVAAGVYRITSPAHDSEVIDAATIGENETAASSSSDSEPASSSSSPQSSSSSLAGLVLDTDGNGSFTDSRDNNIYTLVTLGGAVWFSTNARYAAAGATCNSNDPYAATGCQGYGRFYTYALAVAEACPTGWHVASQLDWEALATLAGGSSLAGATLKSTSGWTTGNGIDSFNFKVMAAGSAASPALGAEAYFWTSTATTDGMAQAVNFSAGSAAITLASTSTTEGLNIRCVLDP